MTITMRDPVSGAVVRQPGSHPYGAKRIRGGSGLGDSVYVRPIADYFVARGDPVTVCTDYPDVFRGSGVTTERFGRDRINVLAHYVRGKTDTRTTQWEDVQASAGVRGLELAFPWEPQNPGLVAALRDRAAGRRLVLVVGGRAPMGRKDGFGIELLPSEQTFGRAVAALGECYLVGVGRDKPIYSFPVHENLNGSTSVADLLDLFQACDGVLAQCSFAVPMAEVFDRPLLAVWAARGLCAREPYIRQITPQKILSKPTSSAVADNEPAEVIEAAARALVERMQGRASACAS